MILHPLNEIHFRLSFNEITSFFQVSLPEVSKEAQCFDELLVFYVERWGRNPTFVLLVFVILQKNYHSSYLYQRMSNVIILNFWLFVDLIFREVLSIKRPSVTASSLSLRKMPRLKKQVTKNKTYILLAKKWMFCLELMLCIGCWSQRLIFVNCYRFGPPVWVYWGLWTHCSGHTDFTPSGERGTPNPHPLQIHPFYLQPGHPGACTSQSRYI